MKTFVTKQQAELAEEFCKTYGLSPEQISFENENTEPFFDFEGLSLLALKLAPIADLVIDLDRIDNENNIVICKCVMELETGQTRSVFASCGIGERLPDGTAVEFLDQATNIARARALRIGLRTVGFDPLRAHRNRQHGEPVSLMVKTEPRNKHLAEIHALAGEIGLLTKDDDSRYRILIRTFFPPHTNAKDLTESQREQFITTLRALARVRQAEHLAEAEAKAA